MRCAASASASAASAITSAGRGGRHRATAAGAARDRAATNSPVRSSRGMRARIVAALRELGYQHVTIDLQGYRMGSLNEGLRLRPV